MMGHPPLIFSEIRPGELVYSALARYARWAMSNGPKSVIESIFGSRSVAASIDLPNRLDALIPLLPGSPTSDDLIDRHTLAPYYTAFLPTPVRFAVRQGMKGEGESLHLLSGLAAFRSGRVSRLRFCPDCANGMRRTWGSEHWLREHQLPSVLVCPDHGTILRVSRVDLHKTNRHEFVAANSDSCPPSADLVIAPVRSADLDTLIRIAKASSALLDAPPDVTDLDSLSESYLAQLRERGLMRSRMRVDQVALEEAFLDRFGGVLHRFPGLMDAGDIRGGWLASLARKQRKACHPIEHLLLRDLLASRPVSSSPCGTGPWPCRNPLTDHNGSDVVVDLRIYRNRGASVAVFSCGCGYRYTRSISDTGELGPCRFKEFGPLLRPALVQMVAEGKSLRGVAARLGVDPKTVATLAAEHDLQTPWSIKPSARDPRPRPVKVVAPSPSRAAREPAGSRRDWRRLDIETASAISRASTDIRAKTPPVRVTAASLERAVLGRRGWLAKRKGKLPRTWAAIADASEALAPFQTRRIDYWISHEADEVEEIRPWMVLRKAGLRMHLLDHARERIKRLGFRADLKRTA